MSRLNLTILFLLFAVLAGVSGGEEITAKSRQELPAYEANVYGPLPFSEEVTEFLHHELNYLLARQNENGSWDSAEPLGNGRTRTEAGGTVGNVTLTAMCGYSLRHYDKYEPRRYEEAIGRAREFVTHMVCSGKLRNNVIDAPWHYIYALRFLIQEYPRIRNLNQKRRVEDACGIIVQELKDTQHGTYGQKSIPFRWERRASPGLEVADTAEAPSAVVACNPDGAAFIAGIRKGDRLISADGSLVDTAVRYAMSEVNWVGGQTIEFLLRRGDEVLKVPVNLPTQYPGTLGVRIRQRDARVVIESMDLLSNRDSVSLRPGDQLVSVAGQKIESAADLEGLPLFAGQRVELEVQRGEELLDLEYVCAPTPAADFGVRFPGGRFDQDSKRGLPIDRFTKGSCLRAAGVRVGDRLIRVDGSLVLNRRHYERLTRSLWGGKEVTIRYLSGEKENEVTVKAGTIANREWLQGYHGLRLGGDQAIDSVAYGSPADKVGCRPGDKILKINGEVVRGRQQASTLLSEIAAGKRLALELQRGDKVLELGVTTNRPADSVWIADRKDAGGGWGYLTNVRGSNTFTTADALRELLVAKQVMPTLDIPDEMLRRAFLMLSVLRTKQPNSDVESYRYDAAGSFWRVRDIRGDIGRLNSAELACLMYCDAFGSAPQHERDARADKDTPIRPAAIDDRHLRTQAHLEKTLQEWLRHRGILDLVKFPSGHADYSIAPWFWMYSYRTTLEAANYLTVNDKLKTKVQKTALKALFKHMEFQYEPKLGSVGWIIGGDRDKELHDSCQLLDGLATMQSLFQSRLVLTEPAYRHALEAFHDTRYGAAYRDVSAAKIAESGKERVTLAKEKAAILRAIEHRFDTRLDEIEEIYWRSPQDGQYYLREMKRHFVGHPRSKQLDELASRWQPELPASSGSAEALDLLAHADPASDSLRGKWTKLDDGRLVSPKQPYARLQLAEAPFTDYRLELQFTRQRGDCLAVIFPVARTSALLVVSGWGGKVSGLAFVDGRDADRNKTTRDGTLSNGDRHTLILEVRLLENGRSRVHVQLDGKNYLDWEGDSNSLTPDSQWKLRRSRALGIGAYDAAIVFHRCRLQMLDKNN